MADGSVAGALQKGCDKDTAAATVALEIRPKRGKGRPGENHNMIGYRGDSGAWCMAAGVGIITFADGSRWLGQVSTSGESPAGRNFLPRPDGLGEMIAADGAREARKVVARADILWGYDLLETLPAAPGGAASAQPPVQTAKASATAAPLPAPAVAKPQPTKPATAAVASASPEPKPAAQSAAQATPEPSKASPPAAGLAMLMASGRSAQPAKAAPSAAPAIGGLFAAVAAPQRPTATATPAPQTASLGARPAAAPAAPAPRTAGVIEGVTGLYMSPFTSDGVTAGWITKSLQVKAAGQIGSMAGNYLGQKAMENVPFVGGFLGKKAGEALGRQAALSAIGGEEFLRASSDLSFNSAQELVDWTMGNYGAREDINQVMQAVIAIYPDVQTPYLVAAQKMAREKKGAGPARTGAAF